MNDRGILRLGLGRGRLWQLKVKEIWRSIEDANIETLRAQRREVRSFRC